MDICTSQQDPLKQQTYIYIKNDYPLIIKYTVASLGEIKLCLAALPSQ